jgi:hypothetical protein
VLECSFEDPALSARLTYCEGLARRPHPFHHAWLLIDGVTVDLTLPPERDLTYDVKLTSAVEQVARQMVDVGFYEPMWDHYAWQRKQFARQDRRRMLGASAGTKGPYHLPHSQTAAPAQGPTPAGSGAGREVRGHRAKLAAVGIAAGGSRAVPCGPLLSARG